MAQLIKLKYPPQKWILKKKAAVIYSNRLMSSPVFNDIQNDVNNINNSLFNAKNAVVSFASKKGELYTAGYQKSIKNYQSRLIIETLILMAEWLLYAQNEAASICRTAEKIAQNITGITEVINSGLILESEIKNKLKELVMVSLYFPGSVFNVIKSKYSILPAVFNNLDLYCCHEHETGASVDVRLFETSLHLDFDENDADKILSNVQMALNLK